jgi:DNA-binding HxlR family transcriptional regulator
MKMPRPATRSESVARRSGSGGELEAVVTAVENINQLVHVKNRTYNRDVVHRSYDQYCPIAAALDVLGDRWTLLIMRELSMGERRFTDLKSALPGIAPNLLSDRLRDLQAEGLVEQRELPPPAARTVYAATTAGRAVVPVLRALARFGVERLAPPAEDVEVKPQMAVYAMVSPYHVAEPVGQRFHARLLVDGRTFDVLTDGPQLSLRPRPEDAPDVEIEISARDLVAARQGTAATLPASPGAQRFARLFQLA